MVSAITASARHAVKALYAIPGSAASAGITETEANKWITDGCPAAPCNFQALMAAAKQAVDSDNLALLASTDVYWACDRVATQMQDTNIVASCPPPSLLRPAHSSHSLSWW